MMFLSGLFLIAITFTHHSHSLPLPFQVALNFRNAHNPAALVQIDKLSRDYAKFRALLKNSSSQTDIIIEKMKGEICLAVEKLSPPGLVNDACWDWLAADVLEAHIQIAPLPEIKSVNVYSQTFEYLSNVIDAVKTCKSKSPNFKLILDYIYCRCLGLQTIIFSIRECVFNNDMELMEPLTFLEKVTYKVLYEKFNETVKELPNSVPLFKRSFGCEESGRVNSASVVVDKPYTSNKWNIITLQQATSREALQLLIISNHRSTTPTNDIIYNINSTLPLKGFAERPVDLVFLDCIAQHPKSFRPYTAYYMRNALMLSRRHLINQVIFFALRLAPSKMAAMIGMMIGAEQMEATGFNPTVSILQKTKVAKSINKRLSQYYFASVIYHEEQLMRRLWQEGLLLRLPNMAECDCVDAFFVRLFEEMRVIKELRGKKSAVHKVIFRYTASKYEMAKTWQLPFNDRLCLHSLIRSIID